MYYEDKLSPRNERIQEFAMEQTLAYHYDAGHAWLKVSYDQWEKFAPGTLSPVQFASQFSYLDFTNKVVYLEEDCDAPAFIEWYDLQRSLSQIPNEDGGDQSRVRRLATGTVTTLPVRDEE